MAEVVLKHFSHECALTSPPENEIITYGICNICYKDEPVELACNPCNFDICKVCSNRLQKMSHDFHPEHPLEFSLGEDDDGETRYMVCSGCGNMFSGSRYECKKCDIYLDLGCALMENIFRCWDATEKFHDSHCHILKRCRPGPNANVSSSCLLCELPLSPSAICYGCVHCYLFFHERCLHLPTEIQHPVHPAHPLRRLDYTQVLGDPRTCNACGGGFDGVPFSCLECNLDLHLRCADHLLRGLIHKSHDHKLFCRATKNASESFGEDSPCHICNGTEVISLEMYYYCVECRWNFHLECLEIPEFRVKKRVHIHPLRCKTFIAGSNAMEYCGVCETLIHTGHRVYSCKECAFLGHVECCLRKERPCPLYLKDLDSCGEEITRLTSREDCQTNKIENKLMVNGVEHIHVMIPCKMSELLEEAKCEICGGEIRSSPCKCETCSFQSHNFCAELGWPSIHQFHLNHPLTLLPRPPTKQTVECGICNKKISGFNLFCRICNFIIHISCVLKGKQFIGALHRGQTVIGTWGGSCVVEKHPLYQVSISRSYTFACAVCDKMLNGKVVSCMACGELYHPRCIQVERNEIYDHPLHCCYILSIAVTRGSKCLVCNENIEKYSYECNTCEVNFHLKCIEEAVSGSRTRWYHQHYLYNYWEEDSTRVCSVCSRPCGKSFYGCVSIGCNFCGHVECIGFPWDVKSLHHRHAVTSGYPNSEDQRCSLCGSNYDAGIYTCNHCEDTFHLTCIMSKSDREAATEEEQIEDIYLMYLEKDLFNVIKAEEDSDSDES
uniref:Phorbol-ester/DAG-type domain-containing protein n=1 Tax=Noccaea caerulescens TaxID=107243 RepID=A0A1J3D232_NOCCA